MERPPRPDLEGKSQYKLVILRDDLVLVAHRITGAVPSEFRSIEAARSWGGGLVPIVDRRQPLTAGAPAGGAA